MRKNEATNFPANSPTHSPTNPHHHAVSLLLYSPLHQSMLCYPHSEGAALLQSGAAPAACQVGERQLGSSCLLLSQRHIVGEQTYRISLNSSNSIVRVAPHRSPFLFIFLALIRACLRCPAAHTLLYLLELPQALTSPIHQAN